MAKVGAIILAAGESSRLGKPKQLIELQGKTLLRRVVDAVTDTNCSPTVVVTGIHQAELGNELRTTEAVVLENQNWRRGIGTSIRVGIQHLIENEIDVDGVLLLVCDQPFVNADTIRNLIRLREETKKSIVASNYAGTLGVPALFDRSLFRELLSLSDQAGAKSIILKNRTRVTEFAFPEGAIDIDTWEDWEKLTEASHPERSEGSLTT
jgi:molybdenum cofactor cytidylyltransferase